MFDFCQSLSVRHTWYSYADYFAANFMQATNGSNGTIYVQGIFIDHGLHHHWMTTTNCDVSYLNRTSLAAMNSCIGGNARRSFCCSWVGKSLHNLLAEFL